jgi:hypothetical protein
MPERADTSEVIDLIMFAPLLYSTFIFCFLTAESYRAVAGVLVK